MIGKCQQCLEIKEQQIMYLGRCRWIALKDDTCVVSRMRYDGTLREPGVRFQTPRVFDVDLGAVLHARLIPFKTVQMSRLILRQILP